MSTITNLCLECNGKTHNKKFCSQSCAANYNNRKRSLASRQRQKDTIRAKFGTELLNCISCNKEFIKRTLYSKYCSNKCQHEREKQIKFEQIEAGLIYSSNALRRYLTETRGYKCAECLIDRWRNKPITLHVDHIDGNSDNNFPSNIRFLCPNCHSQTPTYSRNKKKNLKQTKRNINLREKYNFVCV